MSSSKASNGSDKSERPKWVIVELTSFAERERNVEAIKRAATRILGDIEIFIPAVKEKSNNSEELTTFYMDGYVFIKFVEGTNYMKLADTSFFKSVLRNPPRSGNINPYQLLDDKELNPTRVGMKDLKKAKFKINDTVIVIKGVYKNLNGIVVTAYEDKERVQIRVPLRSKPLLMDFPCSFLERAGRIDSE